jgi:hypothetical protein
MDQEIPLDPVPAAAFDAEAGRYRVNHPVFLAYLLKAAARYAQTSCGARWWQPRFWRFLAKVARDRAMANE